MSYIYINSLMLSTFEFMTYFENLSEIFSFSPFHFYLFLSSFPPSLSPLFYSSFPPFFSPSLSVSLCMQMCICHLISSRRLDLGSLIPLFFGWHNQTLVRPNTQKISSVASQIGEISSLLFFIKILITFIVVIKASPFPLPL